MCRKNWTFEYPARKTVRAEGDLKSLKFSIPRHLRFRVVLNILLVMPLPVIAWFLLDGMRFWVVSLLTTGVCLSVLFFYGFRMNRRLLQEMQPVMNREYAPRRLIVAFFVCALIIGTFLWLFLRAVRH